MIVDDIKKSILQSASEGRLVFHNNEDSAKEELDSILEEKKNDKKYSYKNIDIVPFAIPNNWVWVKLEDIMLKITDGTHTTPKYVLEGVPFISVKDLSSGKINFSNTKFITKLEHDLLYKRCNPEFGDLLITKVGTTGIPVIVDTNLEFSLFVSVALLKFNQIKINNKYLYYILSSPVVQSQVTENTRGVGNKNWVLNSIKNTVLPFPPREEQKRIVEKIEELFLKLDELKPIEEKLCEIKRNISNDLLNSIFKFAFEGKLTHQNLNDNTVFELEKKLMVVNKKYIKNENHLIPKNWLEFRLGDLFEIINGFTPLKSNNEFWNKNEVPWFTVDDIRNQGRFINKTKQYISKKALGNSKQRLLPKNSILLCCTASVGEYAYANIELTTNQQFNGLIIKPEFKNYILPMYLFEYVKTLKKKLIDKSGKTTFNFLSTKKLSEFIIPIPPIEEQKRIIDKIGELSPLCNDIENLVNN